MLLTAKPSLQALFFFFFTVMRGDSHKKINYLLGLVAHICAPSIERLRQKNYHEASLDYLVSSRPI